MPILFVGNTAAEISGGVEDTNAANFDAAYSSNCILVNIAFDNGTFPLDVFFDAPASDNLWFHTRIRYLNTLGFTSNADGSFMRFRNASGQTVADIDMSNAQWIPRVLGDSTVTGLAFNVPANDQSNWDFNIDMTGGNIKFDLYKNGALQSSLTVANTGGKTAPTQANFHHTDICTVAATICYSEIIVTDNESTLGWRLSTLDPDADGFHTDWTGTFADLLSQDATRISGDTDGFKQSWSLSAYGGPASPSSIRAVISKTFSQKGIAGVANVLPFLRIGGTDYDFAGGNISPNGVDPEMAIFDNDPSTASPWNTTALATIEAGLQAKT